MNSWLMSGVADGDLNSDSTWADVDDWYVEDGHFTDIMNLFCRIMKYATIIMVVMAFYTVMVLFHKKD